jgi:enoyl-CoA hydratase
MSEQGQVLYERRGAVGCVTFDRPAARNAMTWTMYEQMADACARMQRDGEVRAAVFRGAGGKAFVAGTDIAQFTAFRSGEDGIAYEQKVAAYLAAVEELRVPTLAVIEGWCVGGGLAIAAVCDLRIATPESRFGVPIARTLGNCLSAANLALLVAGFGVTAVKRMLLLAEMLTAAEAHAAGFLTEVAPAEGIAARADEMCQRLCGNAPITMRVTKESLRRLRHAALPDDADLIRACYGSADFRTGVEAFVAKAAPPWKGA